LKLGKKRRESSKRNYYIIFPRVIIKAIIVIATREVVCEKERVARGLIKSHPLTPELSAELFAQKGIGVFQFSAALIEWSQSELEGLQKIWVQAYTNAWHVPWSSANSLPNCTTAEGGHECPLPSGVLTQALLQHVDQCMRHEDVVKKLY